MLSAPARAGGVSAVAAGPRRTAAAATPKTLYGHAALTPDRRARTRAEAEARSASTPAAASDPATDPSDTSTNVIVGMAVADRAFEAAQAVQEEVLQAAREGMGLQPALLGPPGAGVLGSVATDGALHVASADGSSAAVARAFRGSGLRWLSASTIASGGVGFGALRVLGFVEPGTEAPHLSLGHKIEGGKIQVTATLMHRRTLLLDKEYFRRFYCTAPAEGLPSYAELFSRCAGHEGWSVYTSPNVDARLLLEGSLSFTFAPTEENLERWRLAALDLTRLWVALVKRGGEAGAGGEEVAQYDALYDSEMNGLVMMVAAWLFGEAAGATLQAAMVGSGPE